MSHAKLVFSMIESLDELVDERRFGNGVMYLSYAVSS